jgi:hypothetical protein
VVKSVRIRSSSCGKEGTENDYKIFVGNISGQPKVKRPVGRPNILWLI